MTPLKAVRRVCLACVGSPDEAKECGGDKCLGGQGDEKGACYFFPYRMGKGRPSVKDIRKFCLKCMGGSYKLVARCITVDCCVHVYRFGTNPKRASTGRKDAFKKR